jgi:hypothetical protein
MLVFLDCGDSLYRGGIYQQLVYLQVFDSSPNEQQCYFFQMKIWTSTLRNDDKIIAYINDIIYKVNPPLQDIDKYLMNRPEISTTSPVNIIIQ